MYRGPETVNLSVITELGEASSMDEILPVLERTRNCATTTLKIFRIVLAKMQEDVALLALQELGLWIMRVVALRDTESRAMVLSVGGIRTVVLAMMYHLASENLQELGCNLLALFAEVTEDNTMIRNHRGITAVLNATSRHLRNQQVQYHGLRVLRSLVPNRVSQKAIVEEGGLELISRAMQRFRLVAAVQAEGCQLLCGLVDNSEDILAEVNNCGGLNLIMTAMSEHPGDVAVQLAGLIAIFSLCAEFSGNKEVACKMGLLEVMVRAMKTFRKDPQVQEHGCYALVELLKVWCNAEQFRSLGGAELLQVIVSEHPSSWHVQQATVCAFQTLQHSLSSPSQKPEVLESPPAARRRCAWQMHLEKNVVAKLWAM